jgi:hypothetical protein
METKIDEIREHIYEIKLDLREHIRRTDQNEEMIKLLKVEIDQEKKLTDPVRKAYIGAKWSIAAVAFIAGMAATLSRFL